MANLRASLDMALKYHQEGNLTQAETLYRQILQQWPGQPDALNLLGVMANQVGRTEVALELIGQALAKLPNEPDFHGNFAAALQAAGRVPEAIHHYREAIRLKPGSVTYHHVLLSEALQQTGSSGRGPGASPGNALGSILTRPRPTASLEIWPRTNTIP